MRSVLSAFSVRLPIRSAPRVRCVRVRSCSRGVRVPPPWLGVACARRAVPLQGAGRAVPGGLCPSAFPAPVPCSAYLALGGLARSFRPLAWLAVARPPAGRPAFSCWPCALWGRQEGARGGRLFLWLWGVRVWALFHARPPVPGACGRGPPATGCGCGGSGRGDPSSTPLRALVRAGFARCVGGTKAPGGGASCLGVGRAGWALPHARPLILGACGRSPLRTGCGCGGCGRGDPSHTPQHALLRAGFARCGGRTGAPRRGASCLAVGRPGLGTGPHPTALPWGVRPGPATHWLWVRGVWALEPVTNPTPRTRASWLCTLWGRHEGTQGRGGASSLAVGRPGLGALARPTARPWGVRPGPATHWLWVRGVWAWVPATHPTARALASWLCALWKRLEGARGGLLMPSCGASGRGRSPTPDRPSLGRAAGARHPLAAGAGGAGVGTRHLAHSARSYELALRAVGLARGHWRRAPLAWLWASGVERSPTPDRPSLGHAAGARYPLATDAGGVGVGTRHLCHSARSCELALRAVGAARGRPGGCLLPGSGASGVGRSPLHDRPSLGRAVGARYPLAVGAGGVGVGTRHLPHSPRSCDLALRAVRAA